jgi:hypothetical protein
MEAVAAFCGRWQFDLIGEEISTSLLTAQTCVGQWKESYNSSGPQLSLVTLTRCGLAQSNRHLKTIHNPETLIAVGP